LPRYGRTLFTDLTSSPTTFFGQRETRPQVLLLDEPSLGLAPKMVDEIFAVISNVNELGASVLLVEQNASRAIEVAGYCYVLELGEMVFGGTPEDLRASAVVRAAFL
jgi:branched-chain amino acid transport system ATP-binding protein